jgi:hypothetical protein
VQQPPFDWNENNGQFAQYSHIGQPTRFEFPWMTYNLRQHVASPTPFLH